MVFFFLNSHILLFKKKVFLQKILCSIFLLLLFYVDPAFIRHTRVSGIMGVGCLDVWILIFSKLYKY